MPGLPVCLKCWCEPLVRTRIHPSAFKSRMTSVDDNTVP